MKIGVIIARFQTPYLHEGHLNLINQVTTYHDTTVIILGISTITSTYNPLDYYSRQKMIQATFPNIVILPLKDQDQDDVWSKQLDALIHDTFPGMDAILYGSRDSFIPSYSGDFNTKELAQKGNYNATELRQQHANQILSSQDFRTGIIYAVNNLHTQVYPTIEVAIFKNDNNEILLHKQSKESKWALIGGDLIKPEDECYEHAALREVKQKTGAIETASFTYEISKAVNESRHTSKHGNIISLLYSCEYLAGNLKPEDNIESLQWFKVSNLIGMIQKNIIKKSHTEFIKILFDKYNY